MKHFHIAPVQSRIYVGSSHSKFLCPCGLGWRANGNSSRQTTYAQSWVDPIAFAADNERSNWDCDDPGMTAVWEFLVAAAKENIVLVSLSYSFGSMTVPSGALGPIFHIIWYVHFCLCPWQVTTLTATFHLANVRPICLGTWYVRLLVVLSIYSLADTP